MKGIDCISCPLRDKCIDKETKHRTLTITDDRPYIDKIKLSNLMPDYKRMMRKTVMEGTFSHAKTWCGMRYARGVGRASMWIQAALTAIVINIKKLVVHVRKIAKNGQLSRTQCIFWHQGTSEMPQNRNIDVSGAVYGNSHAFSRRS